MNGGFRGMGVEESAEYRFSLLARPRRRRMEERATLREEPLQVDGAVLARAAGALLTVLQVPAR